MKKLLIELLYGKAKTGIPVSQIKSSTHEVRPDIQVPISRMHEVLYSAMNDIQRKLREN